MKYRPLGRTGIQVSVVCQGGWSIVPDDPTWGPQPLEDSLAAIRASLDAGVNFFDTAEGYGAGQSEEILARALGPRRKDVVIASKVSPANLQPKALKKHCEASLRRLRSDSLDLYQVHWPNPAVPLADTLGAMERLRQAGKIRAIGVSNFGASFLGEALELRRVASNQLCYSLLWRAIEHQVQPLCLRHDVSILTYGSLCQGLLAGKFRSADDVPPGRARTRLFSKDRPQSRHGEAGCEELAFQVLAAVRAVAERLGQPMGRVALAWLLAQPGVTSAIVGGRNARQAAENASAADLELPADVLAELSRLSQPVKDHIGLNADQWQTPSRMER